MGKGVVRKIEPNGRRASGPILLGDCGLLDQVLPTLIRILGRTGCQMLDAGQDSLGDID